MYSQYAFAVYPIAVQAAGATGIVTPALAADSDMPLGHDLAAMQRAITADTRLVFVANPNNPTGTYVPAAELRRFVSEVPSHAIVVLDEAYFEYAGGLDIQNGIPWVAEFPNLVVVRTFSKAYGLAGLRVGYAVSHPSVADMLNRVRQAFNVSSVALAGAVAALEDDAHVSAAVAVAVAERVRVAAALRAMGTPTIPTAGNFLLLHAGPDALRRFDALLRAGDHRAAGRELRSARTPARDARNGGAERQIPVGLAKDLDSLKLNESRTDFRTRRHDRRTLQFR